MIILWLLKRGGGKFWTNMIVPVRPCSHISAPTTVCMNSYLIISISFLAQSWLTGVFMSLRRIFHHSRRRNEWFSTHLIKFTQIFFHVVGGGGPFCPWDLPALALDIEKTPFKDPTPPGGKGRHLIICIQYILSAERMPSNFSRSYDNVSLTVETIQEEVLIWVAIHESSYCFRTSTVRIIKRRIIHMYYCCHLPPRERRHINNNIRGKVNRRQVPSHAGDKINYEAPAVTVVHQACWASSLFCY